MYKCEIWTPEGGWPNTPTPSAIIGVIQFKFDILVDNTFVCRYIIVLVLVTEVSIYHYSVLLMLIAFQL